METKILEKPKRERLKKKLKKITIKLEFPLPQIKDNQEYKIETITLGRLKAKHFKLFPDSFFEKKGKDIRPQDIIPLLGGLSGLDEDIIGDLDFEDLAIICDKVKDFLA